MARMEVSVTRTAVEATRLKKVNGSNIAIAELVGMEAMKEVWGLYCNMPRRSLDSIHTNLSRIDCQELNPIGANLPDGDLRILIVLGARSYDRHMVVHTSVGNIAKLFANTYMDWLKQQHGGEQLISIVRQIVVTVDYGYASATVSISAHSRDEVLIAAE